MSPPSCAHCGSSRSVVGRYIGARQVDVEQGRVVCCSDSTNPHPIGSVAEREWLKEETYDRR